MAGTSDDPEIPGALRRRLLERTEGDLRRMQAALAAGEFALIVQLGHRLAGAAGALGYAALAQAGKRLERAGERRDRSRIRAGLAAAAAVLQRAPDATVPAPQRP